MQNKHFLQFNCQGCHQSINFSLFDIDKDDSLICCSHCSKKYAFHDTILKRQLKKFEALCRQIVDSEEILSQTAVGIDVGHQQVQVPYKLLLTRFNSILNLKIGDHPLVITFRVEPLKDLPKHDKALQP